MYCDNCGNEIENGWLYCQQCGAKVLDVEGNNEVTSQKANNLTVGYSLKINDPSFRRYIKSTNNYSVYFSLAIATLATLGFYIYGEISKDMDNPQSLYVGLIIGAMFLAIAILQVIGRSRSKTWDGVVIKKDILDKQRRNKNWSNDFYMEKYRVYNVIITNDHGKEVIIRTENDDTLYNYYEIGDEVRHHGGLNTYEKFDKSKDTIIFCNACGTLNNIEDDICHRCSCPLLK